MGPNYTQELWHSKGNYKENENTTHRMGDNKWQMKQLTNN